MKAISLWQPWASLLVEPEIGILSGRPKVHETRSWCAPASLKGQRILIHAAKTRAGYHAMDVALHELCLDVWGCSYNHTLPHGAIIGSLTLVNCGATDEVTPANEFDSIAGNWDSGRYAWLTENPAKWSHVLPFRGAQGFFDVPGDIARSEAEAMA